MTVIRVRLGPDSCALYADGHAGSGPVGADLVCAGVSVLIQTLAAALAAYRVPALLVDCGPGRARIACAAAADASLLFGQAALGLQLLARQYPEAVSLSVWDGQESGEDVRVRWTDTQHREGIL